MNKAYYLVLALTFAPMCCYAQQQGEPQGQAAERGHEKPASRPSTFDQVDHIRKELGLTQKQFEKVYSAYSKYNKAVYGDEPFSGMGGGMPPQGGRGGMGGPGGGMGGPGGGMGGPGGGMGGPGGGMGGPGGGMGGPGGGFGGGRPEGMSSNTGNNKAPKEMTEKELEKRRKKLEKQEQKLEKSMRKALNSDDLFGRWQEMHEKQKPHGGPGMPPQPFDKPADAEPETVAE